MRDVWWEEMNLNSPSECTLIYVYLVCTGYIMDALDPRGQSLNVLNSLWPSLCCKLVMHVVMDQEKQTWGSLDFTLIHSIDGILWKFS